MPGSGLNERRDVVAGSTGESAASKGHARASARIEVREVSSRSERRAFIRLPWQLCRSNPFWVPPLLSDIARTLDPTRNPFLKHAETHLYLAWCEGRPVGRIAATVDRLYNAHYGKSTGFWNLFETVNDVSVARALLDRAASDLRERGMTEMEGPADQSAIGQCGLLLEGFDEPPAISMPYNPPEYPALVEQAGCRPVEDFYAYSIDVESLMRDQKRLERLERLEAAIRKRRPNLIVRPLDMRHFEGDILAMGRLFNSALSVLPGLVPTPDEELLQMARDLKPIADPEIVLIAEVEGIAVGSAFGIPDINPILKQINGRLFPFGWARLLRGKRFIRRARIAAYAALPEYRQMGVVPLLMACLLRSARNRGYTSVELSYISASNRPSFQTLEHAIAPRLYKRYRRYSKKL